MEGLITFDEDFDRILLTRIMKTQKSFCNWLLRQWLVAHSCTSQLSPRVCPFPLSSADKDTQRYHDIITHLESREQSPSAATSTQRTSHLSASPSYISMLHLPDYGRITVSPDRTNFFLVLINWETHAKKKTQGIFSDCREGKATGWALRSQGIQPGARHHNCLDLGALLRADNGK